MLLALLACTGASPDDGAPGTDTAGSDTATGPDTADSGAPEEGPDCSGGSGWDVGHGFLEVNGGSAYRFVPEGGADCAPLVFWGHGGGNAGESFDGTWADPLRTGLVGLADRLGFVLVVPGVSEDGDGPTSGATSRSASTASAASSSRRKRTRTSTGAGPGSSGSPRAGT